MLIFRWNCPAGSRNLGAQMLSSLLLWDSVLSYVHYIVYLSQQVQVAGAL